LDYKRIMGLDVGDKRIGIAVSDLLMITAQGIASYTRKTEEEDTAYLKKMAADYQVYKVVCGLPINMNGTIGEQAIKTKEFAEKLKASLGLEVDFFDERLTTASAQRTLIEADVRRSDRKKVVDKLAAVYILQAYMDSIKK
jgi:putative holliday junction resolvase